MRRALILGVLSLLFAFASYCQESIRIEGLASIPLAELQKYIEGDDGTIDYPSTVARLEESGLFRSVRETVDDQGAPIIVVEELPIITSVKLQPRDGALVDISGLLAKNGLLDGSTRYSTKRFESYKDFLKKRLLFDVDSFLLSDSPDGMGILFKGRWRSLFDFDLSFVPIVYPFTHSTPSSGDITGYYFDAQEVSIAPNWRWSPVRPLTSLDIAFGYFNTPYPLDHVPYERSGKSLRAAISAGKQFLGSDAFSLTAGLYAAECLMIKDFGNWSDAELGGTLKASFLIPKGSSGRSISAWGSAGYRPASSSMLWRFGQGIQLPNAIFDSDLFSVSGIVKLDSRNGANTFLPISSSEAMPLRSQKLDSLLSIIQDQVFSSVTGSEAAYSDYYQLNLQYIFPPIWGIAIYDFAPYLEFQAMGNRNDRIQAANLGTGIVFKLNLLNSLKLNTFGLGFYLNVARLAEKGSYEWQFLLFGGT